MSKGNSAPSRAMTMVGSPRPAHNRIQEDSSAAAGEVREDNAAAMQLGENFLINARMLKACRPSTTTSE